MVLGGYTSSSRTSLVELIDLSDPGRQCREPANYPLEINGMVGTYINGKAIVCGGYTGDSSDLNLCYQYDESFDLWSAAPSMQFARYAAASSNLNDTHWLITGGRDEYDKSEVYDSEEKLFHQLSDLPDGTFYHNLVFLNTSKIVMVGGDPATAEVYSFSPRTDHWDSLPDLKTSR